jgi:hypothetical protein
VSEFPFFADEKGRPYPIHEFWQPGLSPAAQLRAARGALEDLKNQVATLDRWKADLRKRADMGAQLADEWIAAARATAVRAQAVIARAEGQRALPGMRLKPSGAAPARLPAPPPEAPIPSRPPNQRSLF